MRPLELLILSAALQAAGNVLQKQRVETRVPNVALGQVTRRPGAFFGPLFRDPRWLLGSLLVVAGAVAGLQALALMDLSVLKALGRLETLFVILAGVVFLGERLRPGETIGVLLLLMGALLLALRSGEASGGAASREAYLVLAAAALGLSVLLAFGRRARTGRVRPELALAAAAGVLFATGDILTKGATDVVEAGTAGGSFSVVESASLVGLAGTPEFGLAIAAYVAGSILTQAAFSVGRVSVIGPVMAIGNLLLPIAFGLLVLREDPTGDRLAGIATIALGTALLGRRPHAAVRSVVRSISGSPTGPRPRGRAGDPILSPADHEPTARDPAATGRRRPLPTLHARYKAIDVAATRWMARHGILLLRVSLGVVFSWFGVLKFFPELSPADELAARTIETLSFGAVPPDVSLPGLALWECLIGLGLLTGRCLRATLLLLFAQMLGTVTPVVLFPHEVFTRIPYAPTLEGQYILKNVVLISAGIVVGATVRGGALLADPSAVPPDRRKPGG